LNEYRLWEQTNLRYEASKSTSYLAMDPTSDETLLPDIIRAKTIDGAAKQVKAKYPGRVFTIIRSTGVDKRKDKK